MSKINHLFLAFGVLTLPGIGYSLGMPGCSLPGLNGSSLTTLIADNASCVVGDKVFSAFESTSSASVTDQMIFHPLVPTPKRSGD